jgi:VWFA-related protein
MKSKVMIAGLVSIMLLNSAPAQTPTQNQKPKVEVSNDEVVRITTSLVQSDVVVTDKNDQIITDLTLADFKIFENGKRQELKFIQFVGNNGEPRFEGSIDIAGHPAELESTRNVSAKDLHRVFAFVVDDLTIPFSDLNSVRTLLTDFVDNKMRDGDLVAIVRVIGGNGLLQQFTSDRRILRRAIAQITPRLHAYSAFNNLPSTERLSSDLTQAAAAEGAPIPDAVVSGGNTNLDATDDGVTRSLRALSSLTTTSEVITSMKLIPGRKSLVLLSGGLPLYEPSHNQVTVGGAPVTLSEGQSYIGNVTYMLRQLTDKAGRAGVVINTLDVRGLKASRGVSSFNDPGNEATSSLFGGASGGRGFGRTPNMGQLDNLALDTLSGHFGLEALAETTGGVAAVNTDNFGAALERVMTRSSYYIIAYTPTEAFDGKFHKLEVKVNRPGAKVFTRQGYVATADAPVKALTNEQLIVRAAMAPLARRDVNVAGRLLYRFTSENRAAIDINLLIDANDLDFKVDPNGRRQATFDVVAFVVNSLGKSEDGFSQTVNVDFAPEEYQRAVINGISFTGHAELPAGAYQLRAVVRESETGRLGTVSQYLEIPDLSKKRLTMSSIFLYSVDLSAGSKATPVPLTALRKLQRNLDLRYAAVIYNTKIEGGKPQLRYQLIISHDKRILLQETEQPVGGPVQEGQMAKVGQFSLAKVPAGRYVLTLVVTDPLAYKKDRTIVRSIDFDLIN